MAITHVINQGWSGNANTPSINVNQTIVGGREANCDEACADNATTEVDIAIPTTSLLSLFMLSTVACVVHTNTDVTGDQDFTLAANTPMVWTSASGADNPITTPVTKLYCHVPGLVAGVLRVRSLAS